MSARLFCDLGTDVAHRGRGPLLLTTERQK